MRSEDRSFSDADSAPFAPLGAVVEDAFAWGDDRRPQVPWENTVIYEAHVKGISKLHPEVDPALRGTYLGLTSEPILAHLVSLGVTTVELLPVQNLYQRPLPRRKGLVELLGLQPAELFCA